MAKQLVAEHIFEPDEGVTHYGPPSRMDQVTLCGIPDWLGGRTKGEITQRPVNCLSCQQIIKFVKSTKFR